jgi:hypothetical protein
LDGGAKSQVQCRCAGLSAPDYSALFRALANKSQSEELVQEKSEANFFENPDLDHGHTSRQTARAMIRYSTATPDETRETLRGLVRRCRRNVGNRGRCRNVRNCLRRQRVRPVMSAIQARWKVRAEVPNQVRSSPFYGFSTQMTDGGR